MTILSKEEFLEKYDYRNNRELLIQHASAAIPVTKQVIGGICYCCGTLDPYSAKEYNKYYEGTNKEPTRFTKFIYHYYKKGIKPKKLDDRDGKLVIPDESGHSLTLTWDNASFEQLGDV